eukprot:2251643-Rhodomonas_salina.1
MWHAARKLGDREFVLFSEQVLSLIDQVRYVPTVPGTFVACGASCLRARYAVPGIDVVCAISCTDTLWVGVDV